MNEPIELFDDPIDIDKIFTVSPEEANQRKLEEDQKKSKQTPLDFKNTNDEQEEEEEEELEDSLQDNFENEDDEQEPSEDEQELLEQVKSLKEMGALFLPDDYEIESLEKALEDSHNYRNNVAVNSVFEQLPNVEIPGLGNTKDLFLYLYQHGGTDIEKFKSTFGESSFNPTKYNLENEDDRRKVIDLYYSKKGFSEAKAKKIVDKIFDDFEDEEEAAEALGELTKISAQEQQNHLKQLETEKLKKQELAEQAYNQQLEILKTKDVVGGYPIGKTEKSVALNSIYKKVNVAGKEMTDFDYRLQGVVLRNPELTLALSAFLNTLSQDSKGNINFDLSKFERKEKTKAVRNLKEEVSRVISGKRKMTSSSNEDRRKDGFKWDSVVDYSELL